MTPFHLNCFSKDPVSKCGHDLRCWGSGLGHANFEGDTSQPGTQVLLSIESGVTEKPKSIAEAGSRLSLSFRRRKGKTCQGPGSPSDSLETDVVAPNRVFPLTHDRTRRFLRCGSLSLWKPICETASGDLVV